MFFLLSYFYSFSISSSSSLFFILIFHFWHFSKYCWWHSFSVLYAYLQIFRLPIIDMPCSESSLMLQLAITLHYVHVFLSTASKKRNTRRKRTQRRWCQQEKDAVERHLLPLILRKKVPFKGDNIMRCKQAEKSLSERKWTTIRDYCRNRISMSVNAWRLLANVPQWLKISMYS